MGSTPFIKWKTTHFHFGFLVINRSILKLEQKIGYFWNQRDLRNTMVTRKEIKHWVWRPPLNVSQPWKLRELRFAHFLLVEIPHLEAVVFENPSSSLASQKRNNVALQIANQNARKADIVFTYRSLASWILLQGVLVSGKIRKKVWYTNIEGQDP